MYIIGTVVSEPEVSTPLTSNLDIENDRRTVPSVQNIRGYFEKFVDWWQCAAIMQREAVTVMPICSGGCRS
jgi:hypothetical protein